MLAKKKCVRHGEREAVARCPSCAGDFCRECIVEHDGRILCASCLAREVVRVESAPGEGRRKIWEALVTAACALLLVVMFYALGQFVKALPPELHEGAVWRLNL